MILFSTLLLTSLLAPLPQQDAVILQPDAIVAADGSLQEGMSVVVKEGRIVEVAAEPTTAGTTVRLSGVLAPGMIDAFSGHGADRLLTEQSLKTTPDLRAVDGLQLSSPIWESLMARGVTAVHITPDATNVVAGWGALVSTAGKERVIEAKTRMIGSLVQSAINDDRVGPSSLAGAVEILEATFANAAAKEYRNNMWFFVESAESARAMENLTSDLKDSNNHAILMGEVGSFGGAFAGQLVGLPTMSYGALARRAATWELMHKAGVRFAFGTRAGNREWDSLRTSAMALSRFTGSATAAWASVTSNPAEMLGMESEVGSLKVGARADLVLWTGHPLDSTATVTAVFMDGTTAYRATSEEN
ncbi:MAG: amidohydrolase family protein [Planctomycetota bacterium]|nr:amidohydrolase family protein [Planctomycetota bacterium]MDA1114567.1 amidohydrolase family protein [Planctomycetota bacterium]